MEDTKEKRSEAIITFLQDTKDGKYAEIDANNIETPRTMIMREDPLFKNDYSIFFSITNQL